MADVQETPPGPESILADMVEPVHEVTVLVDFFNRMDATEPLIRLITAVAVIVVSVLLLITARVIISRRVGKMDALADEKYRPLRLQAQDLISSEDMKKLWITLWRWVGWGFALVFSLTALTGVLMTSSWTTTLAARMIIMLYSALEYIWLSFVGYLPNLITIVFILFFAKFVIRTIGLVFDGIQSRRIHLKNFYPEWAETSFGIIKLMIYVLTAVIIFPYLPGSSSPAFQGISIFVGVLVSLGSTTAVANVIAGTVLTYTRAFKVGDQVELANTRGRVIERSTFVTRVQTLKNVIVSVPNSMVLNNNIINYSKNMGQTGLLVHTSITIGYDVPWQTVNKLLIAAASKTEGIGIHPEPFVLQTSLEDNYVSYEINGWTRKPEELPRIYSALHANILDEFHGQNVEITSPAFRAVRDGNPITVPEVVPPEESAPDEGAAPA
ncbi:MAG: mechanosensitive ion channel domain-containing protein [Halioglobus sp.]